MYAKGDFFGKKGMSALTLTRRAADMPEKKACRCIAVQDACKSYKRVCDAMLRHAQQLAEFVATIAVRNSAANLGRRPARAIFLGRKLLIAGARPAVEGARFRPARFDFRIGLPNTVDEIRSLKPGADRLHSLPLPPFLGRWVTPTPLPKFTS